MLVIAASPHLEQPTQRTSVSPARTIVRKLSSQSLSVMPNHAVMYRIRPGSAPEVGRIFAESVRPEPIVRDDAGQQIGLLVSTMVFVGEEAVVRVMEFEGELPEIVRHLAGQAEVREVERRLEPYLAEPRDMTSPEGAREYFRRAGMRCVLKRRYDD